MKKYSAVTLRCLLGLLVCMGCNQAIGQICPVAAPTVTWTNESTSSLGIVSGSTFTGDAAITGTFTVDVTLFIMSGADFTMSPSSEIIVNPGCTLRINGGSVLTTQQIVWRGIRVEPGGRVEIDNSTVCGAVDAVNSDVAFAGTPSSVHILSSDLIANQTGVRIQNFSAAPYPLDIQGTTIQGGFLSGASTAQSSRGVVVFNLETGTGLGVTVGSAAGPANAFHDLDIGVEVLSSSAQVFNNTFDGMQDINGLGEGYAVLANASNPSGHVLDVGGIGTSINTMTDCRFGVAARQQDKVTVRGNTYSAPTGPANTGILIRQTSTDVLVRDNVISDFSSRGIFLDDNPGVGGGSCVAQVFGNSISNGSATSMGIFVDEHNGDVLIRENGMGLVFRGITVQSSFLGTNVRTLDNTIVFLSPGLGVTSQVAYGIGYFSVGEGLIEDNLVRGNCPFSGGFGPCTLNTPEDRAIRGIQLAQTSDILVLSNSLNTAGGGLYIEGSNTRGNALCNVFIDCYTGMVFDALPANGFGLVGGDPFYTEVNQTAFAGAHANAENQWQSLLVPGLTPFRSVGINGAQANTVRWWHRSAPATFDMPASSILPSSGSPRVTPAVGAVGECIDDGTEILPEDSIRFTTRMIQQFDSLLAEGSFLSLPNDLFWQLQDLNSESAMNLSAAALYALTSLKQQEEAIQSWSEGDLIAAVNWLTSVTPLHIAEANMLNTLKSRFQAESIHLAASGEAFLNRWQLALPTAEVDALWSLAEANPAISGKAVFWAQSYLDTTIVLNRWVADELSESKLSDVGKNSALLFPNPAHDVIYFKEATIVTLMEVYDALGRKVWAQQGPSVIGRIDCSNWPNGMYTLSWIAVDGSRLNARVLVNHPDQ